MQTGRDCNPGERSQTSFSCNASVVAVPQSNIINGLDAARKAGKRTCEFDEWVQPAKIILSRKVDGAPLYCSVRLRVKAQPNVKAIEVLDYNLAFRQDCKSIRGGS